MARLSELVTATARVLKLEERSVSVCARHLREAGLIQQKGRGKSAAHMGPADAANLVLGMMTSETLREAATNVRLAREATIVDFDDPPAPWPFPFIKDATGASLPLGGALDQLFHEVASRGDPLTDSGLPITQLSFGVQRPGLMSWFNLSDGDPGSYTITFQRRPPSLDGLEGDDLTNEVVRRVVALHDRGETPGMQTSARIHLEDIHALVEVLGEGG